MALTFVYNTEWELRPVWGKWRKGMRYKWPLCRRLFTPSYIISSHYCGCRHWSKGYHKTITGWFLNFALTSFLFLYLHLSLWRKYHTRSRVAPLKKSLLISRRNFEKKYQGLNILRVIYLWHTAISAISPILVLCDKDFRLTQTGLINLLNDVLGTDGWQQQMRDVSKQQVST